MKPSHPAIALALASLLTLPAARGQEPESEPSELFFEVTDVNVVNVEVFVTDKKGDRVSGLTAADFEVYENGDPMEITNFYAVADGRPVAGQGTVAAIPGEGLPARGRLEAPVPPDQRLHLIVYVDNFNLRPQNRNRVLRRTHRFLRTKLDRDDRVMVVSYDRSLHVRQPFTSDISLVIDALTELEELSGSRTIRDAERRKVLEDIEEARDEFEALSEARFFADSVAAEMEFVLDALSNHVSALSGLTGRKALLYISDGLPKTAAEDVFLYVEERFPRAKARSEAFVYDYGTRFRELVSQANAGGITFYTLEAGGLQAHSSISAEYGGTTAGGGMAFIDTIRNANLNAPLYMLADDTGGKAIVNTNAVEAGLGGVAEDFDNYYSLGYQAPHHGDGRYYKIEVKVKRTGLEVRHRRGYRDKTAEARLTDGSIAALYFGFETNPLEADLVFGATSPREGKILLPLTVRIPLGQIALAPQGGNYLGRVKVSVVVMDEDGKVSPVHQQEPLVITIPESDIERARGQYFSYDLGLSVKQGVVRIAVGIRDELGSEISFLRETVRVAA